jgi:hypothetical protein
MYAIGRRVYVKSHDEVGIVSEANFATIGETRHAVYVVSFVNGSDYLCGPSDLRGADYCCDGCDRWMRGIPYGYARDGEYENGLAFCFLCAGPPAERKHYREHAAYWQLTGQTTNERTGQ